MSEHPKANDIVKDFLVYAQNQQYVAVVAMALYFIALLTPVLSINITILGISQSLPVNGSSVMGVVGWLTFVALAALAAVPYVESLKPHGKNLHYAAGALFVLAAVIALFSSPMPHVAPLANGAVQPLASTSPSIGIVLFVLSAAALGWSYWLLIKPAPLAK
jgi:hypothetical protein